MFGTLYICLNVVERLIVCTKSQNLSLKVVHAPFIISSLPNFFLLCMFSLFAFIPSVTSVLYMLLEETYRIQRSRQERVVCFVTPLHLTAKLPTQVINN